MYAMHYKLQKEISIFRINTCVGFRASSQNNTQNGMHRYLAHQGIKTSPVSFYNHLVVSVGTTTAHDLVVLYKE